MSIIFYYAPMSSASPVASALAELDVPHEKVRLDLKAGDQKQPSFLRINPNGKVPTLVVDDTPMFEALAIMLWLGDRYGVDKGLWPAADAPARLVAYSWCAWAYVSYGTAFQLAWVAKHDGLARTATHESGQALDRLLGVLDGHLASHRHVLGASYSLADLVVASAIGYGVTTGVSVESHPHVSRWLEGCQARPAMQAGM